MSVSFFRLGRGAEQTVIPVADDAGLPVDHPLSVLQTDFLLAMIDQHLADIPEEVRTWEERYLARLGASMRTNLRLARQAAQIAKGRGEAA
jgi:hypothetical protein